MKDKDNRYNVQYEPIDILKGDAAIYFRLPKSVIVNKTMLSIRTSIFSYLSIYSGLNGRVLFSIPHFLEWAGYKNDAHAGGINDKVIDTLVALSNLGYIKPFGNAFTSRTACVEIEFNKQLVHETCFKESFGILYWDEVQKIMQYKNNNPYDRYLNGNTVLLVFAYLRQAIYRMANRLKPEERSAEGVAKRRERYIEAYNDNFKSIGVQLGLSERIVSQAVAVLEQLNLIITATAYHFKNVDGKYRTPDVIFANAEKREGEKLLMRGVEYALEEIKRKEKYIQLYNPNYHIRYVSNAIDY